MPTQETYFSGHLCLSQMFSYLDQCRLNLPCSQTMTFELPSVLLFYLCLFHFIMLLCKHADDECLNTHDIFGIDYNGRREITETGKKCLSPCRGRDGADISCPVYESENGTTYEACRIPFCGQYFKTNIKQLNKIKCLKSLSLCLMLCMTMILKSFLMYSSCRFVIILGETGASSGGLGCEFDLYNGVCGWKISSPTSTPFDWDLLDPNESITGGNFSIYNIIIVVHHFISHKFKISL